jgi:DNA-binding transcriptional LysR family regulator
LPLVTDELQSEPLVDLAFVTVVNPSHPLAARRGVIPASALAKHVQLVLSDRTVLTKGRDIGVLSPLTWRLADLGAKLAFLRAGLGWGHMPLHMVKADLDKATLIKIRAEGMPRDALMPMRVVFRKDAPPGPRAGPSLRNLSSSKPVKRSLRAFSAPIGECDTRRLDEFGQCVFEQHIYCIVRTIRRRALPAIILA